LSIQAWKKPNYRLFLSFNRSSVTFYHSIFSLSTCQPGFEGTILSGKVRTSLKRNTLAKVKQSNSRRREC